MRPLVPWLSLLSFSSAFAAPNLAVSDVEAGGVAQIWVQAPLGSPVTAFVSEGAPSGPCTPTYGVDCLELAGGVEVVGATVGGTDGVARLSFPVPAGSAGTTLSVQAVIGGATASVVSTTVVVAAGGDVDQDGLADVDEPGVGTSSSDPDSDGDFLTDGFEWHYFGTSPVAWDTDLGGADDGSELALASDPFDPWDDAWGNDYDQDGLSDAVESAIGTYFYAPDSDWDGLGDAQEYWTLHTDPRTAYSDTDALSDGDEVLVHGTDPLAADSDGGGCVDDEEITWSTDPWASADDDVCGADYDNDGLVDRLEQQWGTNPYFPDTDNDGLSDGDEVLVHHSDPNRGDTDWDGLFDADEVAWGTDPNVADTDGGGAWDGEEVTWGYDPLDDQDDGHVGPDFDQDGLPDGLETTLGTDPYFPDSDWDGLPDGDEHWTVGSDPTRWDTDFGGENDGSEVAGGRDPLSPGDDTP